MKINSFILLIVLLAISASCKEKIKPEIICEIKGMQSDTALIAFFPVANREDQTVDTVVFNNGQLNYTFPVKELHEVMIIPFDLIYKFENGRSYPLPASRIRFYIDAQEHIQISGSIDSQFVDYAVVGNELSKELTLARKMKRDLFKERIAFESNYNALGENSIDENAYWRHRNENNEQYLAQNIAFIEKHPQTHYAARLLLEVKDTARVTQLYEQLTEEAKQTFYGQKISRMVTAWQLTNTGDEIFNIVDQTLNGEAFDLKHLRGRYVLLDFWGSWCKPCLAEMPELKLAVKKYKEQLEIIGIACNDDLDRLQKTIQKYEIDWTQLIEKEGKQYSELFGIRSFPTKILLDPEGKIVKTYVGVSDSFYDELESVLMVD